MLYQRLRCILEVKEARSCRAVATSNSEGTREEGICTSGGLSCPLADLVETRLAELVAARLKVELSWALASTTAAHEGTGRLLCLSLTRLKERAAHALRCETL